MKRSAAILGGDQRQVWLARLLLDDGCEVVTWGLEKGEGPNAVPLTQALEAGVLILPLPVIRGGKLTLPLTDTQLDAEQLWPKLRYDQLLLGGMTSELSPRLMADYGLTLLDYYDREETQTANAVPTALPTGRSYFFWKEVLGGRPNPLFSAQFNQVCRTVTIDTYT